ncbi:MAG TPA: alpha/beta hydrolase [Oculatellaceae cyanobacterium]
MAANLDRLFWQCDSGNDRTKRTPAPDTIPAGFVSEFTRVNQHDVHSISGGTDSDKPPVLLLHGALASRRYLLPTARILSKYRRVFVPEMPGHGASSNPEHALSVPEQANVIALWCRKNTIKRFDLFANSYGCQVAAQLTKDHPELINSLTLSGPTCDPSAPTLLGQAYRLYQDGKFEPPGAQHQLFEDLYDLTLPLALETCRHMLADDITNKLPFIGCSTLVVRGANDPISTQPWNEHIAEKLAKSKLAVIDEAPHCVNYAAAEKLTELLMGFLG